MADDMGDRERSRGERERSGRRDEREKGCKVRLLGGGGRLTIIGKLVS